MNNILEQVNSVCTVIRNSIKYPTTFKILLSKTRKVFKSKNFDLKIKTKRQPFLNHEEFYVNAYYDADAYYVVYYDAGAHSIDHYDADDDAYYGADAYYDADAYDDTNFGAEA